MDTDVSAWFVALVLLSVGLLSLACAPARAVLRAPRLTERVALATVAIVISLTCVEFVSNAFWLLDFAALHEPHSRYLFVGRPDARRNFRHHADNGGHTVLVELDGAGDRLRTLPDPPEATRLIVYGDSFIAAEFSAEPDTFVARLGAEIAKSTGDPVIAINRGVAGYGPDQVLLRLADDLEELRPDLVVVGVFAGNDFGDLIRNKLVRIGSDDRLEWARPSLSAAERRRFRMAHEGPAVLTLAKRAYRGLTVGMRTLVDREDEYAARELAARAQEIREYETDADSITRLYGDGVDLDVRVRPDDPSSTLKRRLLAGVLEQIGDCCARLDIPLLFVVIPAAIDVVADHPHAISRDDYPEYRPDLATTVIAEALLNQGALHVDLFSAMSGGDAAGLYLGANDFHWNDAGQARAAAVVAEFLRRSALPRADDD